MGEQELFLPYWSFLRHRPAMQRERTFIITLVWSSVPCFHCTAYRLGCFVPFLWQVNFSLASYLERVVVLTRAARWLSLTGDVRRNWVRDYKSVRNLAFWARAAILSMGTWTRFSRSNTKLLDDPPPNLLAELQHPRRQPRDIVFWNLPMFVRDTRDKTLLTQTEIQMYKSVFDKRLVVPDLFNLTEKRDMENVNNC